MRKLWPSTASALITALNGSRGFLVDKDDIDFLASDSEPSEDGALRYCVLSVANTGEYPSLYTCHIVESDPSGTLEGLYGVSTS